MERVTKATEYILLGVLSIHHTHSQVTDRLHRTRLTAKLIILKVCYPVTGKEKKVHQVFTESTVCPIEQLVAEVNFFEAGKL